MNKQTFWNLLFTSFVLFNITTSITSMDDILNRLNDPLDDMNGIESQIEQYL